MEDGEGKITDGFELIRPLDGDKGRVWLARETALQREVALKFQADSPDAAAARAALLAEADILARCDHPSIVPFYRTVIPDPPAPAFYVMKALPSNSPTRQLPNFPTLPAVAQLASALACLHGLSPPVAHCGVASENILVDGDGRVVLAGFGSARVLADDDAGVAAKAADIQALGRIFEEALRRKNRHVGRRWKPLLGRMLADDPAERPSAAEVAAALAEPVRGPRRFRWLAAAGAALVAAVAVAMVLVATHSSSAQDAAVLEEVISPRFTSSQTLRPRLPPFSPEAMRRIPWYYHLQTFDGRLPGVQEFHDRLRTFETAHPDWKIGNDTHFPGMLRILRLPGDVQLEMSAVPHGYFRRGFFLASNSTARAEYVISPETVLLTRPFWMARTELTRAQYAAVMRRAPAVPGHAARRLRRGEGRGGRPLDLEGGDLPVGEDLDLADVLRFIDALNALCKLEGERRFRLPTEAEWELACRAFVARPFEGEKRPGDAAWMRENSGGVPHSVAVKMQNPLGLFDMHGNLAEWCADAYGPLADWPPFDPCAAPASNAAPRVVRGGSFRDGEAACDSNIRASARPTDKGYAIRLVALP